MNIFYTLQEDTILYTARGHYFIHCKRTLFYTTREHYYIAYSARGHNFIYSKTTFCSVQNSVLALAVAYRPIGLKYSTL